MSKIQQIRKQRRQRLKLKYKQIHQKQYNTLEAIHEMLEGKMSVKKIKVALISISRTDDVKILQWRSSDDEQKFIQICEQLMNNFEQEKEQSMRSTQKNLSQMNEQIHRLKKSLSQKGILIEDGGDQQDRQLQNNKKQIRQESIKELEKRDDSILKQYPQERQQQKIQQKYQLYSKKTQQQKKILPNEDIQKDSQSIKESQTIEIVYNLVQQKESQYEQEKDQQRLPIIRENKVLGQSQMSGGKSLEKIKIEKDQNHLHENLRKLNAQIIQSQIFQQLKTVGQKSLKQEQNQLNLSARKRQQTQWTQILQSASVEKHEIKTHSKKLNDKKLDTLPEELDNQFYQQQQNQLVKKRVQPQKYLQQKQHTYKKLPKYNPHLQIKKKKKNSKKQQLPVGNNVAQNLYYKLRKKLVDLFAYYVKQLKTNSFTFDGHPQCLDIKTFSSYFKHFKLSEFCKISEVPKLFKKYSINGLWMNQQNFANIHLKMLQLGDDPIKTINQNQRLRQQFNNQYQIAIKSIRISNIPQKQKQPKQKQINVKKVQVDKKSLQTQEKQFKLKQKQINQKKAQFDKKFSEAQEKLRRINQLLDEQQISKLTRKVQKKISSSAQGVHLQNYDPERLKKIVQAHSGIYKQDIIQKLKQRKRQKQRRNELKVNQILKKYKNQNNQPTNSGSSFNKSNNIQSSPNLHRIQGYANRNKIIKHAVSTPVGSEVQASPSNLRLRSQPKNKPYIQKIKSQNNQGQEQEKEKGLLKKVQVYKQLSLPKLPKRKMREQSIYDSLKQIDTKAQLQFIKSLLFDKTNPSSKQDQLIFNQYYAKQRIIIDKQKTKKLPTQNRMKFT